MIECKHFCLDCNDEWTHKVYDPMDRCSSGDYYRACPEHSKVKTEAYPKDNCEHFCPNCEGTWKHTWYKECVDFTQVCPSHALANA